MMKRMLSFTLALVMILSMASLTLFTVSAEEAAVAVATADESTQDEATVDEPKLVLTNMEGEVDGTVIGRMGDINDDKKINVKDSTLIQKHLAKIISLNEKFKALCDVDNNQKLNIKDATTLQKYIAKFDIDCVVWYTLYETGTHKHNYVETLVEVKCETDGYTLKSCICGDESKENIVTANGHDYSVRTTFATCVDKGYTLYSCKNCNYSYKDNFKDATGKHNYNSKYVCGVCGVKCSDVSFEVLRDYIKKHGEYDRDGKFYYYYIDAVVESDVATLVYSEVDNSIGLGCSYAYDGYIDMIVLTITSKGECGFYMYCQDIYESAGLIDMSKFTMDSKKVKDIEYYMFVDGVDKSDALANTIAYIKGALATYEYNDQYSSLPVSIQELGFTSFKLK